MRLKVVGRICSGLLVASIIASCVQAQIKHEIRIAFDMTCGGEDKDIVSSSTLNKRAADGCKYLFDTTSRRAKRICHVFPCIFRTKDQELVELYRGHNYLSERGTLYSIQLNKKEDPSTFIRARSQRFRAALAWRISFCHFSSLPLTYNN
ncbi:hypothetical protein GcM1_111006 [Golovinomyces cichoracearum]|uniref:Uncharacterized protein n=1 Tax=Golovinomyces cichoracearum TaxID=62708 RepID=A0A420JC49_9PEZI|nr:hypothetical protein GcM1_111006 [Golovinomyces cichoracearum]